MNMPPDVPFMKQVSILQNKKAETDEELSISLVSVGLIAIADKNLILKYFL